MDSTEVIIARLVLGYLKSEKCRSAYKEFLRTSQNLQDTGLSKSRYLPTRFVGLTLEDILSQYFEIYKIVQGRLEATNYYNECHSKNSLVEQLLYLLNKVHSSRTSTPCPRSPPESNLGETTPSHTDHVSDIETTPAHTLPGNMRCTSEDSYLYKTPKRKSHSKFSKSDTKVTNVQVADKEDMSEILAQTLLENREFHEKIAQTINKVAEKQYRVSAELDKTVKTVVKETEEDPIFHKLIDEIIEYTNSVDTNKGNESSSTSTSTVKDHSENYDNKAKKVHKHLGSNENIDGTDKSYSDSKKVEEQNNEAIRSIIANSRLSSNMQNENQESQGNNEVIVFDGSLDKYLTSNTCNANTQTQPIQNSLYINTTGGLLMVPPTIPTNITTNLQVDTTKQYYFVNNQPPVSWNVPTIQTPNVLTEQDILKMPTVIVNDNNNKENKTYTTQSVLQTPILTTVKRSALPTLVPKPTIEIPSEYLQYATQGPQKSSLKVMYPTVNKKTGSDETIGNKSSPSLPAKINTSDVSGKVRSLPGNLLEENIQSSEGKLEVDKQESLQLIKDEPAIKTPVRMEPTQKITPKSGSHVRNLDFSTPPKITSTQKKSLKTQQDDKIPAECKKQAAKSLFKSKHQFDNEHTESTKTTEVQTDVTKKRKRSPMTTWDADLRASIPVEEEKKEKKKKGNQSAASTKKVKKKGKKTDREIEQLNTTERDAALLEAALQTPVKNNSGNLEITNVDIVEVEQFQTKKTEPNLDEKKASNEIKNNSEIKIIEVTEPKKVTEVKQHRTEFTEDNAKLILSPSKLNASKRHMDLNSTDEKNKLITPEMVKDGFHYPIKSSKNILPLLNTPLKQDTLPKTPGIQTPMDASTDPNLSASSSAFTPFSKMLEANLKNVDINSLPTPNIPITPNFPPFTPSVDLISPYSNRPTDYSTSSSYYHPSDNEQNRSLEANVIELEKKPIKIHSDVLIVGEQIIVSPEGKINSNTNMDNQNNSLHLTPANEHLNIFNKNVIGKKNLNLMKREMSSDSSSSGDSSSESENGNDSSGLWPDKEGNDTVHKTNVIETPKRTYPLRNRTTINNQDEINKKDVNIKESKICKKQIAKNIKPNPKQLSKTIGKQSNKSQKLTLVQELEKNQTDEVNTNSVGVSTSQQLMLKELEEKRQRTIGKFKNTEKAAPKKTATKPAMRNQNGRLLKIKPIPNLTNSRRKPRKSESPKKVVQSKPQKVNQTSSGSKEDLHDVRNKDHDPSKCKNLTKAPVCKSKDFIANIEKTDKSASDVEAQNLIEGLKERGIHLIHNKSPNKKINEIKTEDENMDNGFSKQDTSKTNAGTGLESKENELSTSELKSELRDTYDNWSCEGENEHVIFDESKIITKSFEDYDTKFLNKKFVGKVFVEEQNIEIEVTMVLTQFNTLLEIPSSVKVQEEQLNTTVRRNKTEKIIYSETTLTEKQLHQPVDIKDSNLIKDVSNAILSEDTPKSDDDLMNYAIVGSIREKTPEGSDSPKSTSRKRKLKSEENSHTEKKCKTLLKKINVDSFLNNIHGGM